MTQKIFTCAALFSQICTVVPGIGLLKLGIFPLPGGERGVDEADMWSAMDQTLAMKVRDDAEFANYLRQVGSYPGGKVFFRPWRFVRDSGGGGWAGLRDNYNTFVVLSERRQHNVRNEAGEVIEEDCDMHLIQAMGNHCKWLKEDFEEETFRRLTVTWLEALSPRTVMAARAKLMDFINEQERKDVQDNLTGFVAFYEREAQRCLHFFAKKGANLAETSFGRDKQVLGVQVHMSEFFHVSCASFIQQGVKMHYHGEGGHEAREHVRTGQQYQDAREEEAAGRRGRHYAMDILEELSEAYIQVTPCEDETRNHKPNAPRTFPKPKRARIEVDLTKEDEPFVVMVRRSRSLENGPRDGPFEWQMDGYKASRAQDAVWMSSKNIAAKKEDVALVQAYLKTAHVHCALAERVEQRYSIGTRMEVRYMTTTTEGHATMLASIALDEKQWRVTSVGAPTPKLTRRGTVNGVLDRSFSVMAMKGTAEYRVIFGYLAGSSEIHFGEHGEEQVSRQRVSCTCAKFQKMMQRTVRSAAVHWCEHLCFLFMQAGVTAGHAYYLQAGFTNNEIADLLEKLGRVVVTPMPTPANLPPGAWMLVPGTNRRATCAASYNKSGGCRTQKTSGEPQPILGSKPRVAVMAKREIEKDGVKTWKDNKLQFCVNYTCCTRVLPKYFRVPPMPTDLPIHPEVELTAEMRNASGALTFRE